MKMKPNKEKKRKKEKFGHRVIMRCPRFIFNDVVINLFSQQRTD